MSNNCLVTKLKGIVDNDNLDYLNHLTFVSPAVSAGSKVSTEIWFASGISVDYEIISGNGTFELNGVDKGTTMTVDQFGRTFNVVHTDSKPVVFLLKNYIQKPVLRIKNVGVNLDRLCAVSNITHINVDTAYRNAEGMDLKLTKLSTLPVGMWQINMYECSKNYLKEGTTSDIGRFTECAQLNIEGGNIISGDISELAPAIHLTEVNLMSQKLTGSLESLGAAMVTAGRTSGTMHMRLRGTVNYVTYKVDGVDTIVPTDIWIKFSTEYDLGYQIFTSRP